MKGLRRKKIVPHPSSLDKLVASAEGAVPVVVAAGLVPIETVEGEDLEEAMDGFVTLVLVLVGSGSGP